MRKKFSKPFVLLAMVGMFFTSSFTNASSIGSYQAESHEIGQYTEDVMADPTALVGLLAAGVAGAYYAGKVVGEFIYNISHSGQEVEMTLVLGGGENANDFSKFDI
ncbi:hypothetical protein E5K00_07010 [Hymenobacter aquaticus]|uniref:DUF4134 domain-containing protein n=1 Tax=Hymenobacter aquaticus TaxID=1867101 RepID=A0A4Z0Q8C0_9BACT|nr:hypothetical protein [Hymenobacter aquaticus]TGE24942.1 hypothetical protein E5K00_07010 [Hymenobacter aquaticus]